MKTIVLGAVICFSLLSTSVGIAFFPHPLKVIDTSYAASEKIERVYGVDLSRTIFQAISEDSFRNYIIKLTENGSRWIQSPTLASEANIAARNWINEELLRVSDNRIEVEILGQHHSILGRLPGYLPINVPAILIGGHYDSVPAGPGANDDGTGIATILELARVLSQYKWPLDIYFGAWNAEEIGLFGSSEVAHILDERGIELLVHYNVDMLLVPHPERLSVLMAYPIGSYQNGKYWADLPSALSSNYGHNRIEPISSSDFSGWQSSDHWPFIQEGYARSLFAHESGFVYDYAYHTGGDVWNNQLYNYRVAIEGVKAIGASIAFSMRRAYQQLIIENYKLILGPGSQKNYSITITGPTLINVTSRWWGGLITFKLYDPQNQLLSNVIRDETSPWEMSVVIKQTVSTEGIYKLFVLNHGSTSTGCDLTYEYNSDIDGNSIPDSEEFWFDTSYFSLDSDFDSLSDAQEMIIGTSWMSEDTDHDSMPDKWEIDNGLDPLDPSDALGDEDGDTLTNLEEYQYGCNPHLVDSDFDKMPDYFEVAHNLNPTYNDSIDDPDHDLVSNLDEYLEGTDPQYAELRIERLVAPITVFLVVTIMIVAGIFLWHKKTR
jgi:hypothetical protein